MRTVMLAVVMLALCTALAPAAWAGQSSAPVDPSIYTELDAVGSGGTVPVIVYAPAHLDDVVAALAKAEYGERLELIGGVATSVDAAELDRLAALPGVTAIAPDAPLFGTGHVETMNVTNLAIGLGALTPPDAGGLTGRGVTVAVVDSGSSEHVDLEDADGSGLVAFVDFVKGRKRAYDDGGHGTFVNGLIAGDGGASLPLDQGGPATTQYRGVAPDAGIVSLKVLDRYGSGRASSLVAAIAWAIAHRDEYGIRVLNLSVEGPVTGATVQDPMALAVEAAWKAGIVVVCAAGNEGDFGNGGILSPGNDPYVITVGALDTLQTADRGDDVMASYSSVGPTMYDEFAKPDLVAPGNRLVSLRARQSFIDRSFPQNRVPVASYIPGAFANEPEQYFTMSGTSAAAPVVSGIVALMLEQDPGLTPDDVKLRLMEAADPLTGVSAHAQGAGVVDTPGALTSETQADGYALSEDLGDGDDILGPGIELAWQKYAWSKYAWSKYAWSKYAWSKYAWSKYAWSKYAWSKYAWSKYAWSVVIDGQ